MASGKPRVSAASARAHTRKNKDSNKFGRAFKRTVPKLLLVLLVIFLAWFYKVLQPPPPNVYGTPSGPTVTAPRVQLHDGRYLAYKEGGTPKVQAKYKVVMVHGFGGSRHTNLPVSQSLADELGIYFVSFDRAGYGQSDPNPNRSIKSEAFDIQELADLLELGPKFYIIALSIGGYSAWGCLKYIPHRLAGMAMLAPVTNYWWSGIPLSEAIKAYRLQPLRDQIALAISHYAPWLTYWWNTQKLFPRASVIDGRMDFLNTLDKEIIKSSVTLNNPEISNEVTQQSVHESQHRDIMIMFGRWDFDPGDLENPFVNNEGALHIWHGDEDYLVPVLLQRYICRRLPWVHYHEIPGVGHFLPGVEGLPDQIIKSLLVGDQ